MKIAIVGDLHLGFTCRKGPIMSAVVKGQYAYIDAMIAEWKALGVERVVFLGDIFTNEAFITTDVLDYALRLFRDKLADFKVHIIAGNHDMRYVDSADVCSISFLGALPNVSVYVNSVGVEKFDGKTWYFVPWVLPANMDNVSKWFVKMSRGDISNRVIVGHFDIVGANMGAGNVAKVGFDPKRLLNAAEWTFSGHYHVPSEMSSDGDDGKVSRLLYTGSPYHMSFSHIGTDCGYYLMDGDKLEFHENKVSPRFISVKDTELDSLPDDLSSCIVKFSADSAQSADALSDMKLRISSKNPVYIDQAYYGEDGNIVDTTEEVDEEEARRIMSATSVEMAEMYMDKYPDILPKLNDATADPKQKIVSMLTEYDAK